jgi:hypothetical protein
MHGKIIGITGLYGAGKDTVADIICMMYPEFGFSKLSLADGVRRVFTQITGEDVPNEYTQDWKAQYNSVIGKTNREILEGIGNGLRESISPDIWINSLLIQLKRGGNYVIPDVRYENELRAIEQRGGLMIRVVRPDNPTPQTNSASNSDLSGFDMITIENSGQVGDLLSKVISVTEQYITGGK